MMVAMLLEDMLADLQCEVVGPAFHLDQALAIASREAIDFAILDVNLGGEQSYPVAGVLRGRGIPFIFATGYGTRGLAEAYQDVTTLKKPFTSDDLEQAMPKAAWSDPPANLAGRTAVGEPTRE